jgi:hypothetical protein
MFKAVLEVDLIVNNSLVAAKGSEIYGKVLESVGGRRIGNQRIVVSFDKISIKGQLVAMDTDDVGAGLALLAGGKHIQVPAGSVVEVSLKQAITVP